MPDVVGVEAVGGAAAGDGAGGVAVFEGSAEASVGGAGGAAASDGLAVAFEPGFDGGVAGEVAAFGLGEGGSEVE